jgi:hypothetical protein
VQNGSDPIAFDRQFTRVSAAIVSAEYMAHFDPMTIARRHALEVIRDDIHGIVSAEARRVRAAIDELELGSTQLRYQMLDAFRAEQLDKVRACFRPQCQHLTPPIRAMIDYIGRRRLEGAADDGAMVLPYYNFCNMPPFASFVASLLFKAQWAARVSNSHVSFTTLLLNVAPNSYSETRLIPVHFLMVGAAGVGKSLIMERHQLLRVPGTCRYKQVRSLFVFLHFRLIYSRFKEWIEQYETAMSRFTDNIQNDLTDLQVRRRSVCFLSAVCP